MSEQDSDLGDKIARELEAEAPEGARIGVEPRAAGGYLARVSLAEGAPLETRLDLTVAAVQAGRRHGVQVIAAVGGEDAATPTTAETLAGRCPSAQAARGLLRGALTRYRALALELREARAYPQHLTLGLLAELAEDVLTLLAATRDVALDPARLEESFAAAFADNTSFTTRDAALVHYLRGLAARRVGVEWEGPRRRDDAWTDERDEALDTLDALLDRAERWARDAMATEAELTRRKKRWRLGWGTIGVALAGGLIWALIPAASLAPIADESVITAPGGIVGVYYDGVNFETEKATRVDRRINLRTGGKPHRNLAKNDEFSIRWEGFLRFPEAGEFVVCTENDDGARLWVGDQMVVDDWEKHGTKRTCGDVKVEAGWYPLKVEFFDFVKTANMKLLRGTSKGNATVVPPEDLCCRE